MMCKPSDADTISANDSNKDGTSLIVEFVAARPIKRGELVLIEVANFFEYVGDVTYGNGADDYCVDFKFD